MKALLAALALACLIAGPAEARVHHGASHRTTVHHSGALDTMVHELVHACGARVISGYRPGAVVAGTHRPSLHASNRARDLKGNYGCMYRHLAGWRGGYSLDPWIGHIHVSLGGREDGARFYHGGGVRYASRHHRRA